MCRHSAARSRRGCGRITRGWRPPERETLVKLLSYNVLEGALPDRLPTVLRVISSAGADVVAIQEARYWRRNRRETFRRVGRSLRMRGVLARANSGFDLAVFTRLPILSRANPGLDTTLVHTTASLDLRGPSGETLTLFVTHLRPDYPGRLREARVLLGWLRPYRRRHAVMCGDLNSLTPGDPVSKRLIRPGSALDRGPRRVAPLIAREGWQDCFRLRNPRAPGFTLGARRRVARVDYIFASKPLSERLVGCQVLRHPELSSASDHSPIWAEFDI